MGFGLHHAVGRFQVRDVNFQLRKNLCANQQDMARRSPRLPLPSVICSFMPALSIQSVVEVSRKVA